MNVKAGAKGELGVDTEKEKFLTVQNLEQKFMRK